MHNQYLLVIWRQVMQCIGLRSPSAAQKTYQDLFAMNKQLLTDEFISTTNYLVLFMTCHSFLTCVSFSVESATKCVSINIT